MKRILITGADGFLGKHLVKCLSARGHQVTASNFNIIHLSEIESFLKDYPPFELVIHLAGISHVKHCENDPHGAFEVNVIGTHNLIKSLLKIDNSFGLIFPSTGQVYKTNNQAVNETTPLEPKNFYSQTKLMSENIIQTYANKYNFKSVVLRLFTHTHKSQSPDFFLTSVYQQLLTAKNENRSAVLKTGDTTLLRDFSAIQDLLKAFEILAAQNDILTNSSFEIFNISSNQPKRLSDMINELGKRLNIAFDLQRLESLLRLHDPPVIWGDNSKFSKTYNWSPKRSQDVNSLITSFLEDI